MKKILLLLLVMGLSLSAMASSHLKGSFEEKTAQAFKILEEARSTYVKSGDEGTIEYNNSQERIEESKLFVKENFPNIKWGENDRCLRSRNAGGYTEYWCKDKDGYECYVSKFSGSPSYASEGCP